ncbi:hypothetical protein WSM22_38600 [Cytophagales bacterium WSM2-2]|nr:hypothetical protein WSM22_38600 [Cytophagales bacterium WSM2-2]
MERAVAAVTRAEKYNSLRQFDQYLFDSKKSIKKPEIFISIDGGRISTLGNVLAISGPPKCGKTSFAGALIAGSLNSSMCKESIDTLGLDIQPNTERHEMIYINTELGLYDFDNLVRKMLSRANLKDKPEFFHALNLTGLSPSKLIQKTDEFISEVARINGIRAIIIDGIADYVSNVNDPEACGVVTQHFLGVAKLHNCVVVEIIHKNPGKGDTKSRGHLGSDLARKCEATIELKPDGKCIIISGKDIRNAAPDFVPRLMQYDSVKEYFVSAGTKTSIKFERYKNKVAEDMSRLKNVFGNSETMKYGDLVTRIMPEFKIQDRAAKMRIKAFAAADLLHKNDHGLYELKKK